MARVCLWKPVVCQPLRGLLPLAMFGCLGIAISVDGQEPHTSGRLQRATTPGAAIVLTTESPSPPLVDERPAIDRKAIALPPASNEQALKPAPRASKFPITSVLSGLAVVLGILAGVTWLARRPQRGGSGLPSEVLQVLGRCELAPRQSAVLVRCGQRVLLVGLSPQGARTLVEIAEPQEVNRLCAACATNGSSAAFQDVYRQLERAPISRSFA
jgi:flagellar biosynthetic protein FliO